MIRVESSDNPSISFKNTDLSGGSANDGEYQLFATGNPANPSIAPGSFGLYYDHPSAAGYRFSVNKDGNVGIGTGMPTTKLDVNGDIKTSGTLTAGTVTYPSTHGTSGQVLSTTGSGTLTWTSASSDTHTIGESYGGGIVFYVTTNGLHGLITETQDQSTSCSWYDAEDIISTSNNHSQQGSLFTDWRLPNKYELNLLYLQKVAGKVGAFANLKYFCSTSNGLYDAWAQNFTNGTLDSEYSKVSRAYVRAIRSF